MHHGKISPSRTLLARRCQLPAGSCDAASSRVSTSPAPIEVYLHLEHRVHPARVELHLALRSRQEFAHRQLQLAHPPRVVRSRFGPDVRLRLYIIPRTCRRRPEIRWRPPGGVDEGGAGARRAGIRRRVPGCLSHHFCFHSGCRCCHRPRSLRPGVHKTRASSNLITTRTAGSLAGMGLWALRLSEGVVPPNAPHH